MSIKPMTFTKLLLFILVFGWNSAIADIAPKPGFAHETKTEFKSDPEIIYGTLPNGLRYALQKWDKPKDTVSIRLRVAVGFANEADDEVGYTHFIEHMAFNGTQKYKEGELIPLLQKEGLKFGADSNAFTSFDNTTYVLELPKSSQLDLGLNIFSDIADKMMLSPEAIEREKGVILAEERGRHGPIQDYFDDVRTKLYEGLLFEKRTGVSSEKSMNAVSSDRLRAIYSKYYTPERSFLVVVGNIDIEKTKKMIAEKFGGWKTGQTQAEPNVGEVKPRPDAVDKWVSDIFPIKIDLMKLRKYTQWPDNDEFWVKRKASSMARDIVNERLQKLALKPEAAFTNAYISWVGDETANYQATGGNILPKPNADIKIAIAQFENEIRRALEFGFTQSEIDARISDMKLSYERAPEKEKSRFSPGIASAILGAFSSYDVVENAEARLARFNKLHQFITKEAIDKQFKEDWGDDIPQFYVTLREKNDNIGDIVKMAWNDAKKITLAAPVIEAKKSWEYLNFGNEAPTFTKKTDKTLGFSSYKFSNNTNFVYKFMDDQKGKVQIRVNFGEGALSFPADKKFASVFSDAVVTGGGLGKYDQFELEKLNSGKYVASGFQVGDEFFTLSGSTTKDDFGLQMQNLAAFYTDPAYRPQSFDQMKTFLGMMFDFADSAPEFVLSRYSDSIISPNDIRRKLETKADYEGVKIFDISNIIDKARKEGPLEIIVVGDIKEQDALNAIKSTFGKMPKRAEKPNPYSAERKRKFATIPKTTILEHKGAKDQTAIQIVFKTGSFKDGKEARKVSVLKDVLKIYLTDVLREKYSQLYGLSVNSVASGFEDDFGYLSVTINPATEKADEAFEILKKSIEDIGNGKFDNSLFDRAMKPNLESIAKEKNYSSFWIYTLSNSSFKKGELEKIHSKPKDFKAMKLNDIKIVAKKYLDLNKAQIIKVVPAKEAPKPAP